MMKRRHSVILFVVLVFLSFAFVVHSAKIRVPMDKKTEDGKEKMIQLSSGGHILGFKSSEMYIASTSHMLKVEFAGSNIIEPVSNSVSDKIDGKAAELSRVSYNNLWEDINLVYDKTKSGVFKSTYYISPSDKGRDALDQIRLKYNVPVSIEKSGNLLFSFETGQLKESKPIAWQDIAGKRVYVSIEYRKIGDKEIGFKVDNYNPEYDLVIDPVLSWNTFLGSASIDRGNYITIDGSGNIYITGVSFDTWGSPVNAYAGGSNDAFVAKLNNSGVLQWHTFLGGAGSDEGYGISVDSSGNIYIAGYSSIVTWGSPVNAHSGGYDAFAAMLDSSGVLQWNTFLGTASYDLGHDLSIDSSGNVYITGYSDATWGSPVNAHSGGNDVLVAKLNNSGVLQWNTFLGSASIDQGNGICVDSSGNVYITGQSGAWGSPVNAHSGGNDVLVAMLDSNGVLQWHTFLGSASSDIGRGVSIDSSGNIYITGVSFDTWGSPVNAYTGMEDVFAAKLNNSGVLQWNTFLGTASCSDYGYDISIDGSGNIYIAGMSYATWGSPVNAHAGMYDAFAAKLNNSGVLQWHTFLGSTAQDMGYGICVDNSGNVYLTGISGATWGSPVNAYAGAEDIFVAKLSLPTISGSAGIAGATLSYTDGSAKTATADGSGNYTFTVSYNWSGTVTPSMTGYTFAPVNRTYTNVTSDQTAQNYTATPIIPIISGSAGVAGATLSYTDGSAKTATADGSGNYTFTVSYNWSGTVTPSKTGYTFAPVNKVYANVTINQTGQNYTATAITPTISGSAGVAGATLSYTDGSAKTATADGSGNYTFTVSYDWSGTVTPSMTGYTFAPVNRTYANVTTNQTGQNYTATAITPTISGSAGVAGATLSYTDGSAKTATADGSGNYTFTVSYNWSGTITPSLTGYTFVPVNRTYTNVISDQTAQNYTATAITYTISGNAEVAGTTLSYTDGSAKTATADGSGNYTFTVSYNWSGTVTPSMTSYTFAPVNRTYSNVTSNQTAQNYTATAITPIISGSAGIAGATLSYTDGSAKTATADGSGNYTFTVSYDWSGTVTPSLTGFTFAPVNKAYSNVTSNQTAQNYTATAITPTISGSAGTSGATLSYTDGSAKTATADASGNYTFTVSYDWSGTITPTMTGYIFTPTNTVYTNVISDQTNQDYTANAIIVLTTASVSDIASTTAKSGGNVTSGGGSPITSRGVCWSKMANPTIANSKTSNGSGTGTFTSNITGLKSNTSYYVRAYATNSSGTSYGNDRSFTTGKEENKLAVSTQDVSSIEKTTAIGNGNLISLGISNPTAHGVCWSITKTPTIAGSHKDEGKADSIGTFTLEITGLTENTMYYVRAYATDINGIVYGEEVSFTTKSSLPPSILLSRTYLNFGSDESNITMSQNFIIYNSGGSTLNWTLTNNASWLSCTPISGTGIALINVSVDTRGLSAGTYTDIINVIDSNAGNSPQTVKITLVVKNQGSTSAPFGSFDTPIDGSTVRSSIAVTGWALDDVEVETLKIYRDPLSGEGNALIYIGDAVFVEGARTDVEALYPDYPLNYRAGWGYMLLTNFLPNKGNGTFVLYAKAFDKEGNETLLGSKTIICDNVNAEKPFGAIDTPVQGGIASGGSFVNFGWALTPQPNTIPFDGSTIQVYIDGVSLGNPVYNIYRADIATLFPGYNNSDGAVGYFYIDTIVYDNGVHTIQWSAEDNAGNLDGIGSRFFTIINISSDKKSTASNNMMIDIKDLNNYSIDYEPIEFIKGFSSSDLTSSFADLRFVPVDNSRLEIKELERIVLNFKTESKNTNYTGYLKAGNKLRKLPIGSSLKDGKFYWSPGPGFIGNYDLIFVDLINKTRKEVKIIIKPMFGLESVGREELKVEG